METPKAFSLSIAPMMQYTDKHFHYLCRLISKDILCYSEMLHANAVNYREGEHWLPDGKLGGIAVQLGGACPDALRKAARKLRNKDFVELNLNVGCPSPRVQKGAFGACLMKAPSLVASLTSAMQEGFDGKVTVKTRIGVDDHDSEDQLHHFVETVSATGVETFIIHARKAWLKGLNPKANRDVPPLKYEVVYRLKQSFPHLNIIINGGIQDLSEAMSHAHELDGAMIGRRAYKEPWMFATGKSRLQVLLGYLDYVEKNRQYYPLSSLLKPCLGLFFDQQYARHVRRLFNQVVQREITLHKLRDHFSVSTSMV